jgi:hypothetical protein
VPDHPLSNHVHRPVWRAYACFPTDLLLGPPSLFVACRGGTRSGPHFLLGFEHRRVDFAGYEREGFLRNDLTSSA